MSAPVIHWFRNDLRLADNAALSAALARGGSVVPVYILDDEVPSARALGAASRWWLHHSLARLGETLAARGAGLVLRRGPTVPALCRLVEETGAQLVTLTRGYEPGAPDQEAAVAEALRAKGIDCRRYGGALLHEPEELRSGEGGVYRVFTPFYKACRRRPSPSQTLPVPEGLPALPDGLVSEPLESWGLLPSKPDWASGLRETWRPGEAAAGERLDVFVDAGLSAYGDRRDFPGEIATSRLSPHLRFGEIGPRQIWHRVTQAIEEGDGRGEAYLRQLYWREFSYHLLFDRPDLPAQPMRGEFADFPWREDGAALSAWSRGRTGYPIVDAGMRELWQTGWMHNRVRMVVASFLVKHLLVSWRAGEAWFRDTLVDADPANNVASWQWVAGCGADAAPYFRIFNPILQGRRFDPEGAYVRRWLPELAELSNERIHSPWEAGNSELERAGVRLGQSYPRPMVDHAAARARALAAFATLKKSGD
jgi:deoxyribodipyrimidine photo-lyase